ncbi:hypothetical protein KIPB_009746, partial [Kipferlia bialata]
VQVAEDAQTGVSVTWEDEDWTPTHTRDGHSEPDMCLRYPGCARVGAGVYVFGGYSPTRGNDQSEHTVYVHSLTSGTWRKADCSEDNYEWQDDWPRGKERPYVFGLGHILVIGGGIFEPVGPDTVVWGLDTRKCRWSTEKGLAIPGVWSTLPDSPIRIDRSTGCVIGDTAHILAEDQHLTFSLESG